MCNEIWGYLAQKNALRLGIFQNLLEYCQFSLCEFLEPKCHDII